ncbi:hypothetical protein HY495_00515 [Candidatus Woesearchaeota archaeon]|nr:hypothetical protein [Candidatus Woesearchaeota archaeon]
MIQSNAFDLTEASTDNKLAREIQRYSQEQKESWRRIPYLALSADHRCGVLDTLATVYNKGLWGVGKKERSSYPMYVDLATGIIADPDHSLRRNVIVPARQEEVLILASHLDQIDAKKIVAGLEDLAKEHYSPDENAWRNQIRARLNLSEMYVRPSDWSYR